MNETDVRRLKTWHRHRKRLLKLQESVGPGGILHRCAMLESVLELMGYKIDSEEVVQIDRVLKVWRHGILPADTNMSVCHTNKGKGKRGRPVKTITIPTE